MDIRACSVIAILAALVPFLSTPVIGSNSVETNPCGRLGTIDIPDPTGDASPGAPAYVDIVGIHIRQSRTHIQIEWDTADASFDSDDVLFADEQILRLFFDTDRDPATGSTYGGLGVELRIELGVYPGEAVLNYFDSLGNWLPERLEWVPATFSGNGFVILMERHLALSDHFDLLFESIGIQPWFDSGPSREVQLEDSGGLPEFRIAAENVVLPEAPPLSYMSQPSNQLQLSASLVSGSAVDPVDPAAVSYVVSHPRPDFVPDPSALISVDAAGVATYRSEGFVFVRAQMSGCLFESSPLILATGDVYGDPQRDHVVAVFPTDYVPAGSSHDFGDMMSGFPDTMRVLNLQYDVSTGLYDGYRPLGGDTQVLALIVNDGLCGGPGNPMQTAPCCYMNCVDASPHYQLIHHEMGHNFQELEGMHQLLHQNNDRIANSGFGECSASLPLIFFQQEVVANGSAYGIFPGSYEYLYFESYRDQGCSDSQATLEGFEQAIGTGAISGIFDPTFAEGVAAYCAFFEQYSCGYVAGPNPHGNQALRRFLHVFGDRELPGFIPEKAETYFGATYGLAVGVDMRAKLRFWGFTIDDVYYQQIRPLIQLRLEQAEGRIFHDSFETGENGSWLVIGGEDVQHQRAAAYGGSFGLAIEVAPCASSEDLVLSNHTVLGAESFEACESVTAGDDFVIAGGGEATFTAGRVIELQDGFRVEATGKLSAAVRASLSPFAFIQDDSPESEMTYNVEFRLNLERLSVAGSDELEHLVAYQDQAPVMKLILRSGPEISLAVKDDVGGWHSTAGGVLSPGWNKVRVDWEAASGASVLVTLNDGAPGELSGLETGSRRIDFIRWGAVAGTVSETSGTLELDDFVSWR